MRKSKNGQIILPVKIPILNEQVRICVRLFRVSFCIITLKKRSHLATGKKGYFSRKTTWNFGFGTQNLSTPSIQLPWLAVGERRNEDIRIRKSTLSIPCKAYLSCLKIACTVFAFTNSAKLVKIASQMNLNKIVSSGISFRQCNKDHSNKAQLSKNYFLLTEHS